YCLFDHRGLENHVRIDESNYVSVGRSRAGVALCGPFGADQHDLISPPRSKSTSRIAGAIVDHDERNGSRLSSDRPETGIEGARRLMGWHDNRNMRAVAFGLPLGVQMLCHGTCFGSRRFTVTRESASAAEARAARAAG